MARCAAIVYAKRGQRRCATAARVGEYPALCVRHRQTSHARGLVQLLPRTPRRDLPALPEHVPPLPFTRDEWQIAVECSNALLALDSCRQYGLITGGPGISGEHCARLVRLGEERGITPQRDPVEVLRELGFV